MEAVILVTWDNSRVINADIKELSEKHMLRDCEKLHPADTNSKLGLARGGSDGIRCDIDGNVWSSAGWAGDGYNGVHVFSPAGQRIGLIKLPETGSNLCFGGQKRNRLFMTASQSLYSVYVNTQGAHWC